MGMVTLANIPAAPLAARLSELTVRPWWRRHWFTLLCAAFAAAPGLLALARNHWSTEQGAAGPIILMTGLWLLHREMGSMRYRPDRSAWWIVPLLLMLLGAFTVAAAITFKQWLQLLGIYLCLVTVLYGLLGWRQLRRLWAPLTYLAFVIPAPDNLVVPVTHMLKGLVADGATSALAWSGYPAARDGVLLYIGQYELVVAAACSGMNSLISLTAIGLFYVYLLHRAHWRYAVMLALLMIPVAVFANMVRVITLLLITYHLGEDAGQGQLHQVAGLSIFLVALATLVALDAVLAPLLLGKRRT